MGLNLAVFAEEWGRGTLRDPMQHFRARDRKSCPCCGHRGYFVTAGWNGQPDFRCPNCASRPRDRQIALILEQAGIDLTKGRTIHFAPEWPLFRKLKNVPGYVGGDIIDRRNANAKVDITAIGFADESFDFLLCNHVLEHVPDDAKAMSECYRVLKQGGIGIFSVPLSPEPATWNPPPDMPREEVERIVGWDHKLQYGQDFAALLESHGFRVTGCRFPPETRAAHALLDETIFVAVKGREAFAWPPSGGVQ